MATGGRPGAPSPMFSMGLPTPQPIYTRPFLGLDYNESELNLKPGALLDAQGVVVRPKGLYHIPGYDAFVNGAAWSPADNPCLLCVGWGNNGVQYPFLFTQSYIFMPSWTNGYQLIPWNYSTGTASTSGTNVTGIGTLWQTLGINTGDKFTINGSTYTIIDVLSDTSLTLQTSAGTNAAQSYNISRFLNADNQIVDSCQVNDLTLDPYIAVVSPNIQAMSLIPETQVVSNLTNTAAKQPSTGAFQGSCCAFMLGRIWIGNLAIDGSLGMARTRIRWSKTTDTGDFSDATAYLDLMSQSMSFSGAIQRLMPLGTMLVAYLDDAIFAGTPSTTANLPMSWQQVPSGSVGIIGPRAVASIILPRDEANIWGVNTTGHFFVGFDNVYFLSGSSLSLEPIGSKIVRESINKCQYPQRVQVSVDWLRRRVRFGFPRNNPYIENIFDYSWETKEWSYESRKTWMIANLPLSSGWNPTPMLTSTGLNMTDLAGDLMSLSFGTADSFTRSHYVEHNGTLWDSSTDENAVNPDGSANSISIETPDYDEGAPGMVKLWRMLRLKISWEPENVPNCDITFAISVSMNRGTTWRPLGNMTISQGNDEGYINFRATGPHIRFLITSSSPVTPYYLVEMSRIVSLRGMQTDIRQQNAVYGN